MDTNHHSAGCSICVEHVGPFDDYAGMVNALGPAHPESFDYAEDLHWYDGPIVSIGHVPADARPRLDYLFGDGSTGDEPNRVFTTTRHHFVFGDERDLRATLSEHGVPTRATYRLAEEILVYVTITSQIGSPDPRHSCITTRTTYEGFDAADLPGEDVRPAGYASSWGRDEIAQGDGP